MSITYFLFQNFLIISVFFIRSTHDNFKLLHIDKENASSLPLSAAFRFFAFVYKKGSTNVASHQSNHTTLTQISATQHPSHFDENYSCSLHPLLFIPFLFHLSMVWKSKPLRQEICISPLVHVISVNDNNFIAYTTDKR